MDQHPKDECTFRFSNFLITGLCNSFANSLFCTILFLTTPPEVLEPENLFARLAEVFLSKKKKKKYKSLKLDFVDIHHILNF